MSWTEIESASEHNFMPVEGGFTAARRGLVEVPAYGRVFVKLAIDEQTTQWVHQELHAYEWLEQHQYVHAPRLVAHGDNGFALPDLSTWDWKSVWNRPKLDAALIAMDALAELSAEAQANFTVGDFGESLWPDLPRDTSYHHIPHLPASLHAEALALVSGSEVRKRYHGHAVTKPYAGHDLVHDDVRADNFAYNMQTGEGLLVDWNWLSLGNKAFDQTAFLVDVHKHYDVFKNDYADRLDEASLGWLIGFWLKQASIVPESEHMAKLRLFQLESAVRAHQMFEQLVSA